MDNTTEFQLFPIDGMEHITAIDPDHVRTTVDDELEVFSRMDEPWQVPGSGLAHFGPVCGDWRMIMAIADDIKYAFSTF